jgi:hypothetical protein
MLYCKHKHGKLQFCQFCQICQLALRHAYHQTHAARGVQQHQSSKHEYLTLLFEQIMCTHQLVILLHELQVFTLSDWPAVAAAAQQHLQYLSSTEVHHGTVVQHEPCSLSQLNSTLKSLSASCLLLLLLLVVVVVRRPAPSCSSSTLTWHWLGRSWAVHCGGLFSAVAPKPHSKPSGSLRDR